MSLTRNRRHRPNPARGSVASCGVAGNHRPKSRDRDRRPRGERRGLAAVPVRRSPPEQARLRENGETTFGAVDRGPVRANNGKPGRSRGRPPGTTSRPKRRPIRPGKNPSPPGLVAARTLCDGRHVCGKKQSRQEPLGSCTASWLRIIMLNPSAHGSPACRRFSPRGSGSQLVMIIQVFVAQTESTALRQQLLYRVFDQPRLPMIAETLGGHRPDPSVSQSLAAAALLHRT